MNHSDAFRVDCLVIEKSETAPAMRESALFYPAALGRLLRMVVPAEINSNRVEEIIAIADSIPVKRRRRAVEKTAQAILSRSAPRVEYRILHHQSRSHYGLQIADYCCWAILRKWERGDATWYDRIEQVVRNESRIVIE